MILTPNPKNNRPGPAESRKIVVNATRIGETGGLRNFTEKLLDCLQPISEVTAVVPAGVTLNTTVEQIVAPNWLASPAGSSTLRPLLWLFYGLFCFPSKAGMRILSSTHHVLPWRRHQVPTVHDIRPYYYPDTWVQWFNFRFLLPRALRRCDGILTVSNCSKQLLVDVYGLSPQDIHVVSQSVDSHFFHPGSQKENEHERYLLCVGSSWRHKNIAELLRMHHCWSDQYRLKVISGNRWYSDDLARISSECGIRDRIEFLGAIERAELRTLYQGCSALVYPSFMEGFGLPPLEAMCCGRPAIVSDIPLFREVYGEAPIYVKLGEAESWKNAFQELQQFSDERRERAISHARQYSQIRMRECLENALTQIWDGEDPR